MRRLFLICAAILLMLNLTACGSEVKEYNDALKENTTVADRLDNILSEISYDSGYAMKASTVSARDKLVSSVNNLTKLENNHTAFEEKYIGRTGILHPINSAVYAVGGWFYDRQISNATAKASNNYFSYKSAKATDEAYHLSIKQEQENSLGGKISLFFESLFGKKSTGNTTLYNRKSSNSFLKTVIIILIILLLLKLLMKLASRRRRVRAVEPPPPPPRRTAPQSSSRPSGTSRSLFRDACDRYGYDYNQVLNEFNGNKRAAYDWIMQNERGGRY